MIGSLIGRYRVVALLGRGGNGAVYRARDELLARDVAIKVLHADSATSRAAREALLHEARAACALDHPGIASVHDVGEHEGVPYIAMAYCEGDTLRDRIARGSLSPGDAESVLRQLLDAVASAHARGLVHRDLKPANVVLGTDGRARILDFGIARLPGAPTLASEGEVMGTIAYMSPEQARGEAVDHRADLWALGVIGFEMLTGRHPLDDAAQGAVPPRARRGSRPGGADPTRAAPRPVSVGARFARLVGSGAVPGLRHVAPGADPRLAACIDGLLQPSLRDRLRSAREALDVLDGRATRRERWRPRRAIASLAGVASLAAAAALMLVPRAPRPAAPEAVPALGLLPLPCVVAGDPEAAYLADALPGTLVALLARTDGLEIREPPTSLKVNPATADVRSMLEAYDADRALACTVTVQGDRLLVAARVLEADGITVAWSSVREGTRTAYVELVSRVALDVRGALVPGPGDSSLAEPERGPEAELAWQRGQYFLARFNDQRAEADWVEAVRALEQAAELSPSLDDAPASLALLHYWRHPTPAEADLVAAETWTSRALAVNPRCGRALFVRDRAGVARGAAPSPRRLADALRAASDQPEDDFVLSWLAGILNESSLTLSAACSEESVRRHPLVAWNAVGSAWKALALGDAGLALARCDEALRLSPGQPFATLIRVQALAAMGRLDDARRAMGSDGDRVAPLAFDSIVHVTRLALALAAEDPAERRAALDAHAAALEACTVYDCFEELVYLGAEALARAGEGDACAATLARFERDGAVPAFDWLAREPITTALDGSSVGPGVLARARERQAQTIRILEEARMRGELPPFLERPLREGLLE